MTVASSTGRLRPGRKTVTQADLESVETVIAGAQRKNAVISPQEAIVSHHRWAMPWWPPQSTSPVQDHHHPRTSAPWGTMQVDGEKMLMSRTELENKLATSAAGPPRNDLRPGQHDHWRASTTSSRLGPAGWAMITRYGMTEEFDMVALETVQNQYLGRRRPVLLG